MTQCRSRTFLLSILAGFYIAFGAQLSTVVTQDAAQFAGTGISRLLAGAVFSTGLMLVVICGAELFSDNILPVPLGNIVGGVVFVACAYWYIHLPVNSGTGTHGSLR